MTTPAQAEQLTTGQFDDIRRLVLEKARRGMEALRLYRSLPAQEAFHKSNMSERIVRGSNRSGKTLCAAVEIARALTDQDPFLKYRRKDGRCFAVGKDGRHIAQVMWRKLARPGAFHIIRDSGSGQWRAFNPYNPEDWVKRKEARPSPPLVPKRFIKEIAWENKKEGQPSVVKLVNGWEITFLSSLGTPPQGADIDLCWFDEEVVVSDWYPEMSARLLDRQGKFIWSATPQAGTEQLYLLHEQAQFQLGKPDARVGEYILLMDDNPHITAEAKAEFAAKLSEDQRIVRIGGEFALLSYRVFPEFSESVHVVDYFDIPPNWTRYVSIDPGRQVCAVLFAAVPPPEHGDHVYFYNELYMANCDAEAFGKRMAAACEGQVIQAFIIDHHGAGLTDIGSGRSVESQYSEQLAKRKIRSVVSGVNFIWGCDDVQGGVEAARSWLRIREDGTPKVHVLRGKCNAFIEEIKVYRYKRTKEGLTDVPEARGRVHQMANFRYLASYNPRYVKPRPGQKAATGAVAAFRAKQTRQRGGRRQFINLGPGK